MFLRIKLSSKTVKGSVWSLAYSAGAPAAAGDRPEVVSGQRLRTLSDYSSPKHPINLIYALSENCLYSVTYDHSPNTYFAFVIKKKLVIF